MDLKQRAQARFQRRHFLGFMASGAVASVLPQTALGALTTSNLLSQFFSLHSRPDGAPVFWLNRATEYAIINGKWVTVGGRIIIMATRVKALENGNYALPYAEQIVALNAARPKDPPKVTGPFTGSFALQQSGTFTQVIEAKGVNVNYDGSIRTAQDFGGQTMIEQNINVTIQREGSPVETSVELVQIRAQGTARVVDGFLPAQIVATVTRPQLPAKEWPGQSGYLISSYVGSKYSTLDEAYLAASSDERTLLAPFATSWEKLLG
jgi:hypothetical protein